MIAIVPAVMLTLGSGVAMLLEPWASMSSRQLGFVVAAGVFNGCAFPLVPLALREGGFSVVAPFRYSMLVFSAVLGYLFWDYVPGLFPILGMVLVIAAGTCLSRVR